MFESFYFVIVTFSTVGYGDISPDNWLGQLFMLTMICLAFAFIPRQVSHKIKKTKNSGFFLISSMIPLDYAGFQLIRCNYRLLELFKFYVWAALYSCKCFALFSGGRNSFHMEGEEEDRWWVQLTPRGRTPPCGGLYQQSQRRVHHGLPHRVLRK